MDYPNECLIIEKFRQKENPEIHTFIQTALRSLDKYKNMLSSLPSVLITFVKNEELLPSMYQTYSFVWVRVDMAITPQNGFKAHRASALGMLEKDIYGQKNTIQ